MVVLGCIPSLFYPGLRASLGRKLDGFHNRAGQDGEEGIPCPWQDFSPNSLVATTMAITPKHVKARWTKTKTVILNHINPINILKPTSLKHFVIYLSLSTTSNYAMLASFSCIHNLLHSTHPFIWFFTIPLHANAGNISHKYSPLFDHINTTDATYS